MMVYKSILIGICLMLFSCLSSAAVSKVGITDYQATFIPLYDSTGNLNIAIRMYSVNGERYFVCVDPNTLQTRVFLANHLKFRGSQAQDRYLSMQILKSTPYMQLLKNFSGPPYLLQNYGVVRSVKSKFAGVFLTIDMCPATKPFEKRLFVALGNMSDKLQRPIPIAIAISGLWLLNHRQEFLWLLEQQSKHKLDITWINHSFSHPYYSDLPIEKNFLLVDPRHFEQEVLATEKLLLEYGQIPSIYFRFPGLISSQELIEKLNKFGLVAIGSDAWLAKNQQPQSGSFILIHGNGNEAMGVDKFLALLQTKKLRLLALNLGVLAVVMH